MSSNTRVQQAIAESYYEDRLTFEQVETIVGAEAAQNFRVLKQQLTDESISDELVRAFNE